MRGLRECEYCMSARVEDPEVFKVDCTATPDMRCARVFGHDEPLDAHKLKNATMQGSLSEASRPLETGRGSVSNGAKCVRQVVRLVFHKELLFSDRQRACSSAPQRV